MEFWLFCGISTVLLLNVCCMVNLPPVALKHGPLHESLHHLIADEKLNSEIIWNDTQTQIDDNSKLLLTALNYMHNYEQIIDAKLKQLQEMEHYDALQQCFTQYERQIARFNRDLIAKYRICRQALNSSLSQLEEDIKNEMFYLRDAAIEVQELTYDCNITDLRRSDVGHINSMGITMCVISRLGDIRQRILEATHICMDVISRIVVSDMGQNDEDYADDDAGQDDNELLRPGSDNVCLEFGNLRDEFESIYERILMCVKDV